MADPQSSRSARVICLPPSRARSRITRGPGCGRASSLPLRGSTTVSAPPCRTSVRAPMRACLSPPAYRAPAAAWAGSAPASAGREPCSSRRRFTSSGWCRTVRADRAFSGGGAAPPRPSCGRPRRSAAWRRPAWVGEGPAWSRCRPATRPSTRSGWVIASSWATMPPRLAPQHVRPADAGGVEHGDDIGGHVGHGERAGGRSLLPDAAVVHQHAAGSARRSFRSTGSQPRRSRPIPWIRTSHGRRRCMAARSS